MDNWQFILALLFGPRRTVWKHVALESKARMLKKQEEIARLRRALDLLGVPAQALKDPGKAPPLRISVTLAREVMGVVDNA